MVGIIDYGAGNIFSIECALNRLNISHRLVSSPEIFEECRQYIIPGVGHAATAMEKLTNSGLVSLIRTTTKPVLGICLGMQLLCAHSEEGDCDLLGVIPLKVRKFGAESKVPHMGWNNVRFEDSNWNAHYYFVHSYYVEGSAANTIGWSHYGLDFSAAIRRGNFTGLQFHPEKSSAQGELLLRDLLTC